MLVEHHPPTPPDDLETARTFARAGRITEALGVLEACPADADVPERVVPALAVLLDCRLARGEIVAATRIADELSDHACGPGTTGALARHSLGELASARGEHEAAAIWYADAGSVLIDGLDDPENVPWRSGAALALTRLGHRREAVRLARCHLELARCHGSAYAVAQALRTAAATNHDGRAVALLREARGTLTGVLAERLAAQIDADLAVLLSLEGDPASVAESVRLLRSAEQYAGREDLFPLQDRVRRVLERLGEQPRRIRSETLASLTATEQKAARMAAEGLTNREIAGQLRVTVKAVEWHLSHVYRKLGIPGRTSLPDSLGAPV